MTNPNLTSINVILDKSGSMSYVREATISGLNKFIDSQREIPQETIFNIVQFNSEIFESENAFSDIKSFKNLTLSDYVPVGNTALYDAIGITVEKIGKYLANKSENERPSKVIVAIQTDGEENSSKIYDDKKIKEIIQHQESVYSWEFIFLGANQDAVLTGKKFGLAENKCMTYHSDIKGSSLAFATLSESTSRSRMTRSATEFTQTDKTLYASAYDSNAVDLNNLKNSIDSQVIKDLNAVAKTLNDTSRSFKGQPRDINGRFLPK